MSTLNLSLPSLTPKYHGVPRRYEETRPVAIQDYTHRRILGIGYDIHRHTVCRTEDEKNHAVQHAEKQIWLQAEQLKDVAVQNAKEEAALEQDLIVRKLIKQHEKTLKEEVLQVEMAMQKLTMEQVKQENEEAENKLREAVKKVEERCHMESQKAVENARQEERGNAATAAEKMEKAHSQMLQQVKRRASEEKQQALQSLKEAKDKEYQKAKQNIEEEQHKVAKEKINKLTQKYENEINNMKNVIALKNAEIQNLLRTTDMLQATKEELRNSLIHLRDEFQHFIDKSDRFDVGQSDYMVSPLHVLMN